MKEGLIKSRARAGERQIALLSNFQVSSHKMPAGAPPSVCFNKLAPVVRHTHACHSPHLARSKLTTTNRRFFVASRFSDLVRDLVLRGGCRRSLACLLMPSPCSVELIEQHSFVRCVLGKSFGCVHSEGQNSMWVHKCRGVFKCAGDHQPFRCGYPVGLASTYNCSCDDGRQDPFWSLTDEEVATLDQATSGFARPVLDTSLPRFALLLHGLIGTEILSSSESILPHASPHHKARDRGLASRKMILRHCAASHLRHIVHSQAASNVVAVDIVRTQTWTQRLA